METPEKEPVINRAQRRQFLRMFKQKTKRVYYTRKQLAELRKVKKRQRTNRRLGRLHNAR